MCATDMAATRVCVCSVKLCLVLCLFVTFKGSTLKTSLNKTMSTYSDMFRLRNDLNTGENQCLSTELNRAKCKPTLICCLYRAPNADFTKFISNLENCILTLNLDRCYIIILGDMNVHLLLKPAY